MYNLLGNTNKFLSSNIRILIDLFDKMILPICTYICEVWGASLFTMKFSPCDFLSEKQCKSPIDNLHLKFLKHILGVNQRATNWAVLSETNRNSLIKKIIDKMIGYRICIKNSPSPIIQDVLELSKQLHREGKTSWFTSITKIAEITGNRNEFGDFIKTENKSKIQKILDKRWSSKRNEYSQGKLRLYTHLKVRPGFEQYLNLGNPKLRQSITKLRISAHKFPH